MRDLARKHLGSGYSKLNKKELIAALAHFVPALKKLARWRVSCPWLKPAAKPAPATKSPGAYPGKETRAGRGQEEDKEKKAPAEEGARGE